MSTYKDDAFADRLSSAANAKRAAREKFRARNRPIDPVVTSDQTTRLTIGVNCEESIANRKALLGQSS